MLSLKTIRSSSKTIAKVEVNYGEEKITFYGEAGVKLEKKLSNASEETNLYDCLNKYIESTFDEEKSLHLFSLYKKAFKIIENCDHIQYNKTLKELTPIVDGIVDLINPLKYAYFIKQSEFLVIPKNLISATLKGDYPEETTIYDDDYEGLVNLSFITRAIYPIIFMLTQRYKDYLDSNKKDLVFGRLIGSNQTIRNLPGFRKLSQYINFTYSKRPIPIKLDEIGGSENFTDLITYKTIFSRLCVSVIPETEPGKNLATTINSEVQLYESDNKIYRKKETGFDDDEDNRSVYDKYQISEIVNSTKEEAQAEYFAFGLFDEEDKERYKDRFKYQAMGFKIKNPEMIEMVYDNFPDSWNFDLHPHIVTLLQLTFFGEISPMVYYKCSMTQLKAAIAIAQVRLAEWGYQYLPSVLCAIVNETGTRTVTDAFRLNEEDRDYLVSICDIYVNNKEERSMNEAVIAATMFLDKFSNGVWKSNLEISVLNDIELYRRVKKGKLFDLEMDPEIKIEFMKLVKQQNS